MAIDASYKSDLVHIEAIVVALERIARSGDFIASTSAISEPDYWRQRIEALLGRHDLSPADREHAQAVLKRLYGIASIPSEEGVEELSGRRDGVSQKMQENRYE